MFPWLKLCFPKMAQPTKATIAMANVIFFISANIGEGGAINLNGTKRQTSAIKIYIRRSL